MIGTYISCVFGICGITLKSECVKTSNAKQIVFNVVKGICKCYYPCEYVVSKFKG